MLRGRGSHVGKITIVLCGRKVQALQVGEQKGVPLRVPSPITHIHGVGRVGPGSWGGQARHVAGVELEGDVLAGV